jgi:GDPmannose 4,6-dehydratase
MTKIAVITGINGQDGSYLAEYLLNKDYTVVGLHRRSSTNTSYRINHILHNKNLLLEEFDLTDPSSCNYILDKYKPHELYNLAAMSHVATSFKQPSTTFQIDTIGVVNLLEAIVHISPTTRFYQASTSEMFGSNYSTKINSQNSTTEYYQDENTPFAPQSPYAIAKLAAHRLVQIYREAYNIFSCSGILFNHESPRRGENFVTRKITKYIGQLENHLLHNNKKLHLGNLLAKRDWGHAQDYVQAMHLMLVSNQPDDYVISTGQTYTVQDFLNEAFGLINKDYNDYVYIDPELYRPCEVNFLRGDCSKAKSVLGWTPQVSFSDLVKQMVISDIENHKNEKKL